MTHCRFHEQTEDILGTQVQVMANKRKVAEDGQTFLLWHSLLCLQSLWFFFHFHEANNSLSSKGQVRGSRIQFKPKKTEPSQTQFGCSFKLREISLTGLVRVLLPKGQITEPAKLLLPDNYVFLQQFEPCAHSPNFFVWHIKLEPPLQTCKIALVQQWS